MQLRPMTADDAPAVLAIYQAGLDTGTASFEVDAGVWPTWDSHHLPAHRWVAEERGGELLGWAACSPVSGRCVYAGVVEESVYVSPLARGRGVGRALLDRLLDDTDRAGVWTVQAGVFPDNAASVALHLAVGFRVVGTRERLGRHPVDGQWRDVLLLERRSPAVT